MYRKIKSLEWSARKLRVPLLTKGLILDVGSGGNPHPFADVLLEKYQDNQHRYSSITADRPIVLGDANNMPFKANAFEYSLAYHILEHIETPDLFIDELARVSSRGYIETPNALYEMIHPFNVHCLEIFTLDHRLVIRKKPGARGTSNFVTQTDLLNSDLNWRKFFYSNPKYFHNCYYWDGEIEYEIQNPEQDLSWFAGQNVLDETVPFASPRKSLLSIARPHFRKLFKLLRHKNFDLHSILACPDCKSALERESDLYICSNKTCSLRYKAKPIPDFNTSV